MKAIITRNTQLLLARAIDYLRGEYRECSIQRRDPSVDLHARRRRNRPRQIAHLQGWAPTAQTAKTVADFLHFTNGLNVYNNSFRGASAYAIQKGFQSIGAEDNTSSSSPS